MDPTQFLSKMGALHRLNILSRRSSLCFSGSISQHALISDRFQMSSHLPRFAEIAYSLHTRQRFLARAAHRQPQWINREVVCQSPFGCKGGKKHAWIPDVRFYGRSALYAVFEFVSLGGRIGRVFKKASLSAIHIFSHDRPGCLVLNQQRVDQKLEVPVK